MTDELENSKKSLFAVSEEKLLGILLLGFGVLLLLILLVWRAVNQPNDIDLEPASASKHSVWFNENGLILSDEGLANIANPAPTSPAVGGSADSEDLLIAEVAESTQNSLPAQSAVKPKRELAKPAYWVQLASFSQQRNADLFAQEVAMFAPAVEVANSQRETGVISVVRVPVFGDRKKADKISVQLAGELGITPLVLTVAP